MATPPRNQHPAPTFALTGDDGKLKTLGDLSGPNGTLLVFVYGTYCPTCMQTYANLARDQKKFNERAVQIVVVSLDSWNQSIVFKSTMKHDIKFPILSDESGDVHKTYGCYDHSFGAFYISPDGTLIDQIRQNTYPGTTALLRMIDGENAPARST